MSFISYAQNFEDVILHRALQDVQNGFYIDVGAQDPVSDSVTKPFYEAGWRGINIEPVSEWFEKLQLDRPNDTNLQVAVGNYEKEEIFYEVPGTGLSTFIKSIAERHARERGYKIISHTVPLTTLSTICSKYPAPNIHFLKIDVEGYELPVLQGLDLKTYRPWIIVVESTLPNLTVEHHQEWEPVILAQDYEFVYFDGLNRFYLAQEHNKLKDKFTRPLNYFDDIALSGHGSSPLHNQISQIRSSLTEASVKQVSLEEDRRKLDKENSQLKFLTDSLEKKLISTNSALGSMEEARKELDKKNSQLKILTNSLEEKVNNANSALRSMKKENAELLSARQEAESTLQEIRSKHACREKEFEEQKDSLETKLKSLNRELADKAQILLDQEKTLKWVDSEWKTSKRTIEELHQSNHKWWLRSEQLETELAAVYNSHSWRITWPLRKSLQFTKWAFSLPVQLTLRLTGSIKRLARWIVLQIRTFVRAHPALQVQVQTWLDKHPKIGTGLFLLTQSRPASTPSHATSVKPSREKASTFETAELSALTPSEKRIYEKLMSSIEHKSRM